MTPEELEWWTKQLSHPLEHDKGGIMQPSILSNTPPAWAVSTQKSTWEDKNVQMRFIDSMLSADAATVSADDRRPAT